MARFSLRQIRTFAARQPYELTEISNLEETGGGGRGLRVESLIDNVRPELVEVGGNDGFV